MDGIGRKLGARPISPSQAKFVRYTSTSTFEGSVDREQYLRSAGWTADDVRALDEPGDASEPWRDIVAFYHRDEGKVHRFRVDLLDLRYGSEEHDLDLYLLIGFKGDEGSRDYPDGLGKSKVPWKLAVKIYNSRQGYVVDERGNVLAKLKDLRLNSQFDNITFSLPKGLLEKVGWRGQELAFEVATAKDFQGKIDDLCIM